MNFYFAFYRLASKNLDFHNILEEIPVTIKTSNLVNVLISEVIGENPFTGKEEFMSLSTGLEFFSYLLLLSFLCISRAERLICWALKIES